MTVEGLRAPSNPRAVNIGDEIGASVEALTLLGLVEDRDRVKESVTSEFAGLELCGRNGEPYIQLPRKLLTAAELISVWGAVTFPSEHHTKEFSINESLWRQNRISTARYAEINYIKPGQCKPEDLDKLSLGRQLDMTDWPAHGRIAVHNPEGGKKNTRDDPLLHFTKQPFDGVLHHRWSKDMVGQKTQLESLHEAIDAYESEQHEGFEMTALNAQAFIMISLLRRIKGEDSAGGDCWGMIDATTGRFEQYPEASKPGSEPERVVGYVGYVGSGLDLQASWGDLGDGIGLSVGPSMAA